MSDAVMGRSWPTVLNSERSDSQSCGQRGISSSCSISTISGATSNCGSYGSDSEHKQETQSVSASTIDTSQNEKLAASRERNRIHAQKTRQRKKARLLSLQNKRDILRAQLDKLREAVDERATANLLLSLSGTQSNDDCKSCIGSTDNPKIEEVCAQDVISTTDQEDYDDEKEISDLLPMNVSLSLSDLNPEEREQVRRERNRVHAKRTRTRKKRVLHELERDICHIERNVQRLQTILKRQNSNNEGFQASSLVIGSDNRSPLIVCSKPFSFQSSAQLPFIFPSPVCNDSYREPKQVHRHPLLGARTIAHPCPPVSQYYSIVPTYSMPTSQFIHYPGYSPPQPINQVQFNSSIPTSGMYTTPPQHYTYPPQPQLYLANSGPNNLPSISVLRMSDMPRDMRFDSRLH